MIKPHSKIKGVNRTLIERIRIIQEELPESHRAYTDKYFIRSREILAKDGYNPWIRYQVFIRGGPMQLRGVNEAVAIVDKYSKLDDSGGQIYFLPEGSIINQVSSKEPVMILEGPIQELIELETMYLGALSAGTSGSPDLLSIKDEASRIVQAARTKPVLYFGARHFHYTLDEIIADICRKAGFAGTSTDIGAMAWDGEGSGTIPHALVLAYNSTLEAAIKFNTYMPEYVPRIALIDTFNREIEDALRVASVLKGALAGVRIDTCGENEPQGQNEYKELHIPKLTVEEENKYLYGHGVTIAGVWALRRALDEAGFEDVELFVSSGFNASKIEAFVKADKFYKRCYGNQLFSAIGTGSVAPGCVFATSDIVAIYDETRGVWKPRAKVGRGYTPNPKLIPFYNPRRRENV
ncbi:nicotinate phosphoribosyltransferase [Candidatus Woesearchaeota archaeon]|nr:MAG: nicotinate phosphoribosyltransferase [Candidatus Woesearchaeota archaeon]